ncbi:MAG: TniQ family protein [Alphaproteobacteria bacterium]|nr:TniQ family protein [Alphaproteobacteria bacterium]
MKSHPTPRFAVRPAPFPDESLSGYLYRVSSANGHSIKVVLRFLNVRSLQQALKSPAAVARILPLVDGEAKDGWFLGMRVAEGATVPASGLPPERLDLERFWYCPLCVADQTYHRRVWHHPHYVACHIHRVQLVYCDEDTRHGPPVRVGESDDSANYRPQPEPLDSAWSLSLHTELVARVNGTSTLRPSLRSMPFDFLVTAAEALGQAMCGCPQYHPGKDPRRTEDEESLPGVTYAEIGFGAITGSRADFYRALDATVALASQRDGRFGGAKSFGEFAAIMGPELRNRREHELTACFYEYMATRPQIRFEMQRMAVPPMPPADAPIISLGEATRRLRLGKAAARRLLVANSAMPEAAEGSGMPIAVSAAKVARLSSGLSDCLTLIELANHLGIGRARCRGLVEAKLIQPYLPRGACYSSIWHFSRAAIEEFCGKLSHGGVAQIQAAPPGLCSFNRAFNRSMCQQVAFVDIVAALISGRISPTAVTKNATGFSSLLFDKTYAFKMWAELARERRTSFAIQPAARILHLSSQAFRALVKKGLLQCLPSLGGHERGLRLSQEEIDRFQSTYMSGAEVAKQLRTSTKTSFALLQEAGLLPVSGPHVDGGRLNLYRRDDVARYLYEHRPHITSPTKRTHPPPEMDNPWYFLSQGS